jgi:hypothetical protein
VYGRIDGIFAPQVADICTLCEKSSVHPPEYAAESPGCGEKLLELGLRRNASGIPLPQPIKAEILRLRKRAFLAVKRAD